jgi:hypothetical protein
MELQVLAPHVPLDVGKFAALPITPDASSQDTQDGCCAILPKRTRVMVTGNNRTHRKLIGREAIVKKAVGLGGWHHIVSCAAQGLFQRQCHHAVRSLDKLIWRQAELF